MEQCERASEIERVFSSLPSGLPSDPPNRAVRVSEIRESDFSSLWAHPSTMDYRRRSYSMDDLPDNLLHMVVGPLGLKPAVRTSLLAKRWRDVYRSLPIVEIDEDDFVSPDTRTIDEFEFVSAVFAILEGRLLPFERFRLCCGLLDGEGFDDEFKKILECVSIRERTITRELSVVFIGGDFYKIPECVLFNLVLIKLKLEKCWIDVPISFPGLKKLRVLYLNITIISGGDLERLLDNLSELEELSLIHCSKLHNIRITSSSLQKLDVVAFRSLSIVIRSAPCLRSVGVIYDFDEEEVYENIFDDKAATPLEGTGDTDRLIRMVTELQQVNKLCLSISEEFDKEFEDEIYVPNIFPPGNHLINLKELYIGLQFESQKMVSFLTFVLASSPNLKVLTVGDRLYSEIANNDLMVEEDYWEQQPPTVCVNCNLQEVYVILDGDGKIFWVNFVEYLLVNGNMLKKVWICCTKGLRHLFEIQHYISLIVKASANVIIEFEIVKKGKTRNYFARAGLESIC
ncbi:F-box/FBD/LRR-repeat protein At1g13570-like [Typha angustifolia]|uniref:F-box/FBD/LRR-repeat protein At1g13570-like n=1 Tax=Typha angustifolia TaxID=59011 RepID=UPI003C30B061